MTKFRRAALASFLTATLVSVGLASPAGGATRSAAQQPGCDQALFAKARRAQVVAERNPDSFATAASVNGATAKAFQRLARQEASLWLDTCGRAFYVDPAREEAPGAAGAGTAGDTPVIATRPLSETFLLNSKPGSSRTIYLDFTGENVTGTAWNNSYGDPIVAEAYSIDATVDANFSDAELTEIQKVWQFVAEDYAPFDVNVTTQDPGLAAIDRTSSSDLQYGTRAVITTDDTIQSQCGCGGVAYVNVFNTSGSNHLYYQPAWVFTRGVGSGAKNIAEATSHEVGHNFGLNHDGNASTGYYSGSAPWAPIMGVGYYQPVSQWSRGEYSGANNTQDDLAVIATGAPLRTDDHGNTLETATPLPDDTVLNGLVTTRTDTDWFTFTGAGSTTVSVTPGPGSPDLDVELSIFGADGSAVAVVNPAVAKTSSSAATGLGATWTASLPAEGGTFFARVDGVGTGDPLTAGLYSDYASLGNYQVGLVTDTPTSSTPLTSSSTAAPNATVGTSYSATPVTASGGVQPYAWTSSGEPAGLSVSPTTGALSGTPTAAGTYSVTFIATDAVGATTSQVVPLVVDPAPYPAVVVADQSFTGATAGQPYTAQLQATGGDGTYSWTASGVPSGMTISTSGVLSGTPTASGTFTFTANATSAGTSDAATITLSVAPATSPLAWTTSAALPAGRLLRAYSKAILVSGGSPAYTWTKTSGSYPPGLSLSVATDGKSATLSGAPTLLGKYSFTLTVADSTGAVITRTFTISIKR